MTFTSISSNAVLFSTTVTNLVNESREISLAIDANSQFGGESAKISALPHDRGFVMSFTSSSKTFAMIECGYPLVQNISVFWFGAWSSCFSNYWTQMTDLSFFLVILKPAGWSQTTGLSVLFLAAELPLSIHFMYVVVFVGSVSSSDESSELRIAMSVDDHGNLLDIVNSLQSISLFQLTLSFYCLDSKGCVSSGIDFLFSGIGPMPIPLPIPIPTPLCPCCCVSSRIAVGRKSESFLLIQWPWSDIADWVSEEITRFILAF
jgi:hypothetical protein